MSRNGGWDRSFDVIVFVNIIIIPNVDPLLT